MFWMGLKHVLDRTEACSLDGTEARFGWDLSMF